MTTTIRISTSPPDEWDGQAAYYCDLREIYDRRSFPLLHGMPPAARDEALRRGIAGYVVANAYEDRELGLLNHVDDDVEGIVYLGVDCRGRVSRQPAANEALRDAANAGADLQAGHRLDRIDHDRAFVFDAGDPDAS